MAKKNTKNRLTIKDYESVNSNSELLQLIEKKEVNINWVKKRMAYEEELRRLQIELVKLQRWITKTNKRVAVIFEGRDAAGKGGSIRRFAEHLSPRSSRTVALTYRN